MPKSIRALSAWLHDAPLPDWMRTPVGRRATGMALALLIEVLLLLVLLTMGRFEPTRRQAGETLTTFNVAPPAAKQDDEKAEKPEFKNPEQSRTKPVPPQPQEQPQQQAVAPPPPLPSLIPMSAQDMASADISRLPPRPAASAPAKRAMGPADDGSGADTPLMSGTGPNGEPLYAAQWYRKPYDSELSGYLSTASGPGWGLIACKTQLEFRVDHCVIVDEYPTGSRIANAVLQASWQFRVRPPRKGGKPLIGEWVGIRIDYQMRGR